MIKFYRKGNEVFVVKRWINIMVKYYESYSDCFVRF